MKKAEIKSQKERLTESLIAFRKQYPIETGWAIETENIAFPTNRHLFKASIKSPQGQVVATGYAEELHGKLHTVEHAENRAIARALAAAGFSEETTTDIPTAPQDSPNEPKKPAPEASAKPPAEQPDATQPAPAVKQPNEAKSLEKPPTKEIIPPDEAKAEKWAWEHLAEWLDSPCSFAKAQNRTWRQLAENYGDKIVVKGKASLPRAYLHVVESWQSCQVWAKVKAKVALQAVRNGNGVHSHYGHPAEIS